MASSTAAARLSKTTLAAAATALLGSAIFPLKRDESKASSLYHSNGHISSSSALLPPLYHRGLVARCETPKASSSAAATAVNHTKEKKSSDPTDYAGGAGQLGVTSEEEVMYHGLFPRRQLWRPRLEYPLWDYEWDGRQPPPLDADSAISEAKRDRFIRREGVTRHIILVRHGQYDETFPQDEKRILTPLGRQQAAATGKRLGQYIRGINQEFGPCNVKVVRVSNLARAKETAQIIRDNLGEDVDVDVAEPDELLNEGRPCHHIPGGKARQSVIERTDEHHPRIEKAFRKYFHRAPVPEYPVDSEEEKIDAVESSATELTPHPKHEFEIIVCHANVIRYFFCRALQLPPEAWLRLCVFNCSLTYLTIRPTGSVSCRMLGDIGHLRYDESTFSMHTGFNW